MLDELAKIRFARFRFRLRAETPLRLPPYKGSTLRGGFGIAFKEAVCIVEHGDCHRCILRHKCAYSYIFETPVPEGSSRLGSLEHAPHPFVIEPPPDERTRYEVGDTLEFGLILIGRAVEYLPYIVVAFDRLGKVRGIGTRYALPADAPRRELERSNGGRFYIEEVLALTNGEPIKVYDGKTAMLTEQVPIHSITDIPVQPAVSRVDLQLLTPLRLSFERRLASTPHFHIVVRNLLRRLASLAYFHGDRTELRLDFRGLVDAAEGVHLVANGTRWHDWERYSARQDRRLKIGGLVGSAGYEGPIEQFAPLLALGELLHVGKLTAFGLGHIARCSGEAYHA